MTMMMMTQKFILNSRFSKENSVVLPEWVFVGVSKRSPLILFFSTKIGTEAFPAAVKQQYYNKITDISFVTSFFMYKHKQSDNMCKHLLLH